MVLTYSQQINPIRSQVWCPFKEQHTELGTKVTNSYGSYSRYLQVGDGSTASTFPEMIGSKGFRFTGNQYLSFVESSLTLGDAWSICMMIRPKIYVGGITDKYLIGFSNGGGIILNDSGENNELTYNDGVITINSGVELSNDRFYSIIVTKDFLNNITFYINGEEEGSGIGTNSGFDLDYIGCDCSLGNFYDGELREFCVFDFEIAPIQASILDNRLVRVVEGQEFYWNLASLPNLAAWYEAVDEPATLVRATQPVVSDWTTGTGWSGSGEMGPYTHSGGAGDLTQALGIVGNRVQVTYTISSRTAGTLTFSAGTTAGTARSTNATFTEDLTVADNTTLTFAADAAFDGTVTITSVVNLTRTRWNPKAGSLGGYLSQATAAAQPWYDGGIKLSDDTITLSSAFPALHNGSPSTVVLVVTPTALGASKYLLDSGVVGANSIGAQLVCYTIEGGIDYIVKNGAAVALQVRSPSGTLSVGSPSIVTARSNYSANVGKIRINGSADTSATWSAAPSASAANLPSIGANPSYTSSSFAGSFQEIVMVDKYLSDNDVAQLERYFASIYGIALP